MLEWLAFHGDDQSEWASLMPAQTQHEELVPYQRLWLMVFVDALRCAARQQEGHEDARRWLLDPTPAPTGFWWTCEMVGLDPVWTREKVRAILSHGMRAGLSVRGGRSRHRTVGV